MIQVRLTNRVRLKTSLCDNIIILSGMNYNCTTMDIHGDHIQNLMCLHIDCERRYSKIHEQVEKISSTSNRLCTAVSTWAVIMPSSFIIVYLAIPFNTSFTECARLWMKLVIVSGIKQQKQCHTGSTCFLPS